MEKALLYAFISINPRIDRSLKLWKIKELFLYSTVSIIVAIDDLMLFIELKPSLMTTSFVSGPLLCYREFSITNMTGAYRRVFQKPKDFEW